MAFDRTKPYRARNGQKAEIVATLKDGRFLVVYDDIDYGAVYLNGLRYQDNIERAWDVVNIPDKRVVVINHYQDGGDTFWSSQELADDYAGPRRGCTVLEYERPVFDGQ